MNWRLLTESVPVCVAVAVLLAVQTPAQADWFNRTLWRLNAGGRINLDSSDFDYDESERHTGDENFLIGRLALDTFSPIFGEDGDLLLAPFFESRFGVDDGTWERNEVGVRAGVYLDDYLPIPWGIQLNPRLDLQHAWLDGAGDQFELELGADLEIPMPVRIAPEMPVFLYAFEEWTYDFRDGKGTRNEVGAGIGIPCLRGETGRFTLTPKVGWRHLDFIKGADTDYLEILVELTF